MAIPSGPLAPAPWLERGQLALDLHSSPSSELQDNTADECLPFLLGEKHLQLGPDGFPPLSRRLHQRFLQGSLSTLPAGFALLDASRPWMLYWAINGLSLLGHDLSSYQESLVQTLGPIQNRSGGFGGGYGQLSHLATSYAAVLALLTVGGSDALNLIDRKAMWEWLGSLKNPQGDFQMCSGGERDVRGSYCALTIVALLNLPYQLPPSSPARLHGHEAFDDGIGQYIASCQTYEGGIGSVPAAEAHGAYVFCALACLCLIGDPAETLHKYLDVDALMSWLLNRQHAPEGGLAGRSNKLVDGCYSHWIGGCWPLVTAALEGKSSACWNRDALRKYILCCCQGSKGGLRDKPSKAVDSYHSCYNLAGLSSAEHTHNYTKPRDADQRPCSAAFGWNSSVGDVPPDQAVAVMHPVFVMPVDAVARAQEFYRLKGM